MGTGMAPACISPWNDVNDVSMSPSGPGPALPPQKKAH